MAYADLCADPTRVDGAALTQRAHATDPGNFWTISDNYSVTPDKALIKALREAARTGKFKDPTALTSTTLRNEPSEERLYDLQGRRVINPTHGIYIIDGKKLIKQPQQQ